MSTLELARHFISCIEGGDLDGARACFHPDAEIWHNYDRKSQTVDQNMALAAGLLSKSKSLKYNFKRLIEVEGGYLQQHVLCIETKDGTVIEGEAIAMVLVEDGKIRRIEEYLDPSQLAAIR